ncbi:MAG TPA: hypothetical protein VFR67_17550 [Pilimelia sp.]|nr:hypothetical protein [Pilimelia sp.]
MTAPRGFQHDTDVLIRQVNNQLVTLRMSSGEREVVLAELVAAILRGLVIGTTQSSAADRARVRAAVHYFVRRRDTRHDRRPARSLADDLRVVNRIAHDLGRDDLVVDHTSLVS